MALSWNLQHVKNSDALCWLPPAEQDDPAAGIVKGEQYMHPTTNAIIWATVVVGIGHITEKNWQEFYARVRLYRTLDGSPEIDPRAIRLHIGLRTNVSAETRAQWMKRLVGRQLDGYAKHAAEAVQSNTAV